MMLFIPNIILCGHFGNHGDVLIPMLQAEMKRHLLPSMELQIEYHSFERSNYAQGAALLLLEKYLDFDSAWRTLATQQSRQMRLPDSLKESS